MRLKEKEKNSKRSEILNVARKYFSERGFENTSIAEIARKVKIAKGTVYLYFQSKLDLFLEIIKFARENMLSKTKEMAKKPLSASEKIKELIRIHLQLIEDYPEYPKIFSMLTHHADLELKSKVRDIFFNNQDDDPLVIIQSILQEGIEKNEFKPEINIQIETFRIYFISRVFSITMGMIMQDSGTTTWPFYKEIDGEKVMWETLELIINQYKR